MTVAKWDAHAWHQRHATDASGGTRHRNKGRGPARDESAGRHGRPIGLINPATGRRAQAVGYASGKASGGPRKKIAIAMAAAVVMGIVAVSANELTADPGSVGICHATGSAERPFVFLSVAKDGFEHGHHRHHEADFFVDASAGGCSDEHLAAIGGTPAPTDDAPEGPADDGAEGNDTADDGTGGNDTADDITDDDGTYDNGTSGDAGGTGGDTSDGTDENGTDENGTDDADFAAGDDGDMDDDSTDGGDGGAGDGTDEADAAPPAGDVAVAQWVSQDDVRAFLYVEVFAAGEGASKEVTLWEQLPQLYRTWHLGGADARDCVLEGRDLACWFDDLGPGESRTVTLHAYTDRMPCGQPLTGTAWVDAADDAKSNNNGSSASIAARQC